MAAALAVRLEQVLSALPENANPFTATRQLLWSTLDRQLPDSFFTQLRVAAALLGFNLVVVIAVLGLQVAWGKFWLWRWEAGSPRPHATIPWELAGALFYVFAEVVIFRSIPYYRGERLVSDLIGWRTMMWWAPWLGGWIAAHALGSGYIQHLLSTGKVDAPSADTLHRRLAAFICGTLCVFFASMTPVCVIAVRRYHASLDTFEEIDEMLLRQAARFDTTFDMATDLGWMMPAFQRMQQQQQELLKILRILYGLYGGWGLVLNIGFDVTAILHILSLRQLLCQTEALKIGDASGARQSRIFRKTYHTLVVVLITFTFIALGFTAVSFYVAIDINAAMNAAKSIQAVDLTMYYLYAVMGAPVAVLLLVRTIRSRQLSASAASGADGSGSSPPRRSTIFRRGGVTGLGSKHHGRNGGGRIGIDVSTVITVQNGRPGDIPSVRGEHEQFEMVPNARYFAQHAADKQEADSVDRKVQELYFLDLDDDKDVGSTRDGVEKA